jgi:hypothetical protein
MILQTHVQERLCGAPAGEVLSLDTARRRKEALQATRDESRAAALLAGFQAGHLPFIDVIGALISPFNAEAHEAEIRRLADSRP